jgi:hypothetical protein
MSRAAQQIDVKYVLMIFVKLNYPWPMGIFMAIMIIPNNMERDIRTGQK